LVGEATIEIIIEERAVSPAERVVCLSITSDLAVVNTVLNEKLFEVNGCSKSVAEPERRNRNFLPQRNRNRNQNCNKMESQKFSDLHLTFFCYISYNKFDETIFENCFLLSRYGAGTITCQKSEPKP